MARIKLDECAFCLVDVQDKLFPFMQKKEELVKNLEILVKGLKLLKVPFFINEQYKKGIGETIEPIKSIVDDYPHFEKTTFSCCGNSNFLNDIKSTGKNKVIVAGIETHICVLQTCLDLKEAGFEVVLVTNCCSSREENDKNIAIQRLVQNGMILTTYESILFELIQDSKHTNFKEISNLIK